MQRFISVLILSTILCFSVRSQSLNKAVNEAYIIARMIDKFHAEPRVFNDSLSADFYHQLLAALGFVDSCL